MSITFKKRVISQTLEIIHLSRIIFKVNIPIHLFLKLKNFFIVSLIEVVTIVLRMN